MNTADKKRILSTPTVRGELLIEGKKYSFSCTYEMKTRTGSNNVTIDNNLQSIRWINTNICDSFIVVYRYFDDIRLSARIKYSDIAILWAVWDGISDCRQEFEKAIAA